jgi:hypothetical protein
LLDDAAKQALEFENGTITLPQNAPNDIASVIVLEIEK